MQNSELAQKFYDRSYLPAREDFFKVFGTGSDSDSPDLDWTEYSNMIGKGNPIFELWNVEYINALCGYLAQRDCNKAGYPIKVLEVAAGNGRLTHFLKQELEQISPGKFELSATDSGIEKYQIDFPVEKLAHKKAIKKFRPDIIICAWMPMGIDLSDEFRKEKNTKEYILIGPARLGIIGDYWKTWGISHVEKRNIFRKLILPPFIKDGFDYYELAHLAQNQICKMDTPCRVNRGIMLSTTVSFSRII